MDPNPPSWPLPATTTNQPKPRTLSDATASLAPHTTPHGHRPDWQTAMDDLADSQRDALPGG